MSRTTRTRLARTTRASALILVSPLAFSIAAATARADDPPAQEKPPATAEGAPPGAPAADGDKKPADAANPAPAAEEKPGAPATEPVAEEPPSPWSEVEGSLRAGLRLVSGEGEGRFQQDHSLNDGARVFDFEMRAGYGDGADRESRWDLSAHGLGDANQDARARFTKDGRYDVTAGWMRDDYGYRAAGDPFPYDTIRERGDVKVRVTPNRDLTLRFDWNRSVRRGDAFTIGDTDRRPFPPPPGVDPDFVGVRRPIRQEYDAFTVGADIRHEGWRFSLAESARISDIEDTRLYDVAAGNRGADPVREALTRDVRSTSWTTVAKAGVTTLDGDLDVDLIGTFTHAPVDSRAYGSAQGVAGGNGAYTSTFDGGNRLRRGVEDIRVETLYRVNDDVEIAVGLERNEMHDDASVRLNERRDYDDPSVADEVLVTAEEARITNRGERASAEVLWQARENLRLRLGEEFYRQTLENPVSSRGSVLLPTDFASKTFRTIAGADWEPVKRLDLHLLGKVGRNDDPHATPGAEDMNEISFRGRWKASRELSLSSAWKHKGFQHSDDLDSASRTDSATVAATWTPGKWSVSPTLTRQTGDTRTDTTFFSTAGGGFAVVEDQVSFQSRDLIAALDVRYDITKALRAHLTGTLTDSQGDYEARWYDVALGAEYDLSERFTVGADLRAWRLDENDTSVDDYRVLGVEISATWRF